MFKTGDVIKCVRIPDKNHYQLSDGSKAIGKWYVVSTPFCENIKIKGQKGIFDPNNFILYQENLTEVDYLDAFQRNFSEGI